ncbi:MAG: hypothetical protein AAF449_00275 [Myxococcota bacterium]
MYRKEVNAQSPLRILNRSIHGGLGRGNLGVVMARAGVGKTAFLVQVGLDDLMRERDVLHIGIGKNLEHTQSWYDALFDDLARNTQLEDREQVKASISKRRIIQAFTEREFSIAKVEKAIALYTQHLSMTPSAILVDGYEWEGNSVVKIASDLGALRAMASRMNAELWMSAQTHRELVPHHPTKIPEPCVPYESLIDVAVYLEPHGNLVSVRLLKDHDNPKVEETHLELEPDTMQLVTEESSVTPPRLPPSAHTLLSGAANGAESEFGAMAEKWGLSEINFSFAGRTTARDRGVVELSDAELKQGEVNSAYIEAQLHRQFPNTPTFRKMLQSIWHQVVTSGQVFVIGLIQDDGTVRGGTGWAAELGRHFGKPVHVFDQEKKTWFTWVEDRWAEQESPRITRGRFTGTGTRFLSDEGRQAIRELFERSFGPA